MLWRIIIHTVEIGSFKHNVSSNSGEPRVFTVCSRCWVDLDSPCSCSPAGSGGWCLSSGPGRGGPTARWSCTARCRPCRCTLGLRSAKRDSVTSAFELMLQLKPDCLKTWKELLLIWEHKRRFYWKLAEINLLFKICLSHQVISDWTIINTFIILILFTFLFTLFYFCCLVSWLKVFTSIFM